MTIDLDALEKLADEAPDGPWSVHRRDEPRDAFYVLDSRRRQVIHALRGNESRARFIAAANPATIKALIAELKEAREVIARLGSSEAFDMPQAISGPLAGEIRARMDYARAFLARNGKGEG